jgi:butyrate kinase
MKGRLLAVNTGSTSTKIGYFEDGKKVFEQNIAHSAREISVYASVLDQRHMRRNAITDFLVERGIPLEVIDIVMSRGGLITPIRTGVYEINDEMKAALEEGKNGMHACCLCGLIAAEVCDKINEAKAAKGMKADCRAYIADPPMADEMLPEAKVGGLPEFPRRTLFHALNSRAMVRRYAASVGKTNKDVTVIVAHLGGGSSVSLHHCGQVIDCNDALGGDGPMSTERAGSVPGFPLVDKCFSGEYTRMQVRKRLAGRGGAIAYFNTNDFREIIKMADEGNLEAEVFIKGYCLSAAKYIAGIATTICGKVDAIILTGGVCHSKVITGQISERVGFIAPVVIYPGEDELESLAENGYGILSGEFDIKVYHRDHIIE